VVFRPVAPTNIFKYIHDSIHAGKREAEGSAKAIGHDVKVCIHGYHTKGSFRCYSCRPLYSIILITVQILPDRYFSSEYCMLDELYFATVNAKVSI
jgi:hypothetical protein